MWCVVHISLFRGTHGFSFDEEGYFFGFFIDKLMEFNSFDLKYLLHYWLVTTRNLRIVMC